MEERELLRERVSPSGCRAQAHQNPRSLNAHLCFSLFLQERQFLLEESKSPRGDLALNSKLARAVWPPTARAAQAAQAAPRSQECVKATRATLQSQICLDQGCNCPFGALVGLGFVSTILARALHEDDVQRTERWKMCTVRATCKRRGIEYYYFWHLIVAIVITNAEKKQEQSADYHRKSLLT